MLRFLFAQIAHRRSRTVVLGVAVAVASASFVLLTGVARTSELRVQGSVESNYRTAYDVLVRPKGSQLPLEQRRGLVRPNFLSGVFGGISLEQYAAIKEIPGVDVAAPVANLGYTLPFSLLPISAKKHFTNEPHQLYRLRLTWRSDDGSRYPSGTYYVYYTPRDPFTYDIREGIQQFVSGGTTVVNPRDGFYEGSPTPYGPFDPNNRTGLNVFSALTPGQGSDHEILGQGVTPFGGIAPPVFFPIFVSAIDPEQEARLLGLDRTVVSGRYLRDLDRPSIVSIGANGSKRRMIPAIASTRSFLGETLDVAIERLEVPGDVAVPQMLASDRAYDFVTSLPGRVVGRRTQSPTPVYDALLRNRRFGVSVQSYWTVSATRYRQLAAERLEPIPTVNPISVWRDPSYIGNGGFIHAPPQNVDVQFRQLHQRSGSNLFGPGGVYNTASLRIVGRFDPNRLPSFSALSQVPLETYYPPVLLPADSASERVLRGQPLLPTQNLGDYVQQPPLILTTLDGLKPFLNKAYYSGAEPSAPISVIRVRVAGVTGPDELSQARVRSVATAIHDRTGLAVDITAGSSPQPLSVQLSAGKFGRPPLLLTEGWSKKGVSVTFLEALDRKRLALFALILITSGFFLANAAFATVQARRSEIGTLLCLGWSRGQIFRAVLGEMTLVGLLAGALGTALAAAAVQGLALQISIPRLMLVIPVSLALSLVSGVIPAWRAAASIPLDAVRPQIVGSTARTVRSVGRLALVNLLRLPVRTLTAAIGLFVGVAALTLLVAITQAFQGALVGTLLGNAIAVQIRAFDFLAVGLVIALAVLSVADVLFLNLRERAPELVTLRASGWRERDLRRMVAYEAVAIGLLAGGGGSAAGIALGLAIDVPFAQLALAGLLAAAGGLLAAFVASIVPLTYLSRLTPPSVLAAEA
jgi:putative ABC transport system permease protein